MLANGESGSAIKSGSLLSEIKASKGVSQAFIAVPSLPLPSAMMGKTLSPAVGPAPNPGLQNSRIGDSSRSWL